MEENGLLDLSGNLLNQQNQVRSKNKRPWKKTISQLCNSIKKSHT